MTREKWVAVRRHILSPDFSPPFSLFHFLFYVSVMHVSHDILNHRFVAAFPDGEGELVYTERAGKILVYWHTEVSPHLRGRGVGDALVRAAIDYAERGGYHVIPSCSFVAAWLMRHPEHQELLAKSS